MIHPLWSSPTPCGALSRCEQRRTRQARWAGRPALVRRGRPHQPRGDEKHYRQLTHRLGAPLIRELLAAFRRNEVAASVAAEQLGLGRTRFYELYADYLRATAHSPATLWTPGTSGGDHAPDWPAGVEPLLRKLLATQPPAPCRCAASEVHRRLGLQIDPATVRRWAIAHQLAHPAPAPRPPASVRRWQCLKIGALWQLDATPHRWFPGDKQHYPLLDLLDDCSRVCTGATIYHGEDRLAYLDFLPAAFTEYGLPLALYVDCHSFFFPQRPDALTQLGAALHVYGVSLRYARTPQAKGKSASTNAGRAACPPASPPKPSPRPPPPARSCRTCGVAATPTKPIANSSAPPTRRPRRPARSPQRAAPRPPRCLVALYLERPHAHQGRPRWARAHRPRTLARRRGRRHTGHPLPPAQWHPQHPRARTQSRRTPRPPLPNPRLVNPSAFAHTRLSAFEILTTTPCGALVPPPLPCYAARVKLSVKSDYAMRAVLELARAHPSGGVQRVEDIAARHGVPANYLVQILLELKTRGLVRSVRGKEGGYRLAKPPAEITFGDVLRAVNGAVFDTPALANGQCPPELHRAWSRLKTAAESAADAVNFQQLVEEGAEKERMFYI